MADNTRRTDRIADLLISTVPAIDAPPSPPYRQYPASLAEDTQSPPYRSRSNVQLMDDTEKQPSPDVKHEPLTLNDDETKPSQTKSAVHYPDEFSHSISPGYAATKPIKFGSSPPTSRAPSLAPSDDELDEQDFDWSTEDDLVDEEAKKYEQKIGVKRERSKFVRIIAFFLSTLVGSVITAGLIIAAALLVHFFWYNRSNDENRDHRKYVTQNIEAWLFWAAANLLVSWFLAFIINIIPGVVTWAIFIVWGHISESMKSRVELYSSIKETIKPLFYAASGWVSWVILFEHIYKLYNPDDEDASLASYTPRVYQAIEFSFFLVLVLCIQKMLSHLIAFAFHKTAYKDRLQSLKLSLKTLDHLKNYKPKHRHERSSRLFGGFATPPFKVAVFGHRPTNSTPYDEKAQFISGTSRVGTPDPYDDGHAGDCEDNSGSGKKGKGRERHARIKTTSGAFTPTESRPHSPANALSGNLANSVSEHTYPPKLSSIDEPGGSNSTTPGRKNSDDTDGHAVVQAGKALKKAVLHDARNLTGKGGDEDILGWNIGSTREAKKLARSIYHAFKADRRRNYLVVEDFYPAYANHEAALEAFRVFDSDHNSDISRVEIKRTVVDTYRERRFLSRSLRDVGQALSSLDHVLLLFAFIILFFISLSVFGVDVGDSLTSVYTIGIAASFVFKQTCANVFDAIMFLFVTHPFDTGDRCFIDNENLVVKKMGLLATVFTRADGTESYYFNSQLFSKFITNARRSDKTAELCTLYIAWRTPIEKIDALEKCLNDWLAVEENRWFDPNTSITVQRIENQRFMEITISIPHNSNWQDWGLRNSRKTAFYAATTYYCRQLGISYSESPMPIVWANAGAPQKEPTSPTSATNELDEGPVAADMKDMKPMLGFLPPPDKRNNLLHARKSKGGKKSAFRAMDG